MKKLLLFLVLCFAGITPALADTCDDIRPNGLTTVQVATLKQNCLEAIKQNSTDDNDPVKTVDQVQAVASHASQWGTVAKDFAYAIGIAAHELGVQANTFLNTPAGKFTAALIVWKMMGQQILAVFLCVPLIIFTWFAVLRLSRMFLTEKVEYTHTPVLWGLFSRKKIANIVYDTHPGDGQGFMAYFVIPILGIAVTALLLAIIF